MSIAVFKIQDRVVDILRTAYPRCEISTDPNSSADFIVEADERYEKLEVQIVTSMFDSFDFGVKEKIREVYNDAIFRQISSQNGTTLVVVK